MRRNRHTRRADRKAQAQPLSGKDRSAHEAARSKRIPTLAELSRELPNEDEMPHLFPMMENESDRGCALVCGSFVEAAVYMAVCARMVDEPAILKDMFNGSNAPLGSFSAKIKAGLALGMYGPETAKRLTVVKDIRNTFAHALRPLSFTHPTLVAECKKLLAAPLPADHGSITGARVRYITFCRTIFGDLYRHAQAEGGKEIGYTLP